jgi:hypothetical protein
MVNENKSRLIENLMPSGAEFPSDGDDPAEMALVAAMAFGSAGDEYLLLCLKLRKTQPEKRFERILHDKCAWSC